MTRLSQFACVAPADDGGTWSSPSGSGTITGGRLCPGRYAPEITQYANLKP